jgi:3-oxoacyl-[acyl-carrier-protein] synthase III
MIRRPFAEMVSIGVAVPPGVLTNHDLTKMLDTSDEWIVERTGIRERHIARPDQSVAMLSCEASMKALQDAGLTPLDLDAIVLATASPDRLLPSTACDLQALLGADRAAAFDIAAACPGFVFATGVAEGLIASGQSETVLVLGAEKLSTITDFQDRSTAILFGDGAGAVVLRRTSGDDGRGILSTYLRSDGKLAPLLYRPGGGSADPISEKVVCERSHYMKMAGHVRGLRRGHAARRRHRRGDRSPGSPPGEHQDHRSHRQACRDADGQGDGERGPLRQHVVGIDSARAGAGHHRG